MKHGNSKLGGRARDSSWSDEFELLNPKLTQRKSKLQLTQSAHILAGAALALTATKFSEARLRSKGASNAVCAGPLSMSRLLKR